MWLGNLCLTVKRQKTMKKIFNLILAALVIIGAAACAKNDEIVDKTEQGESLSFYAEIVNGDTRACIEKGEGTTWNTIWDEGDNVYVSLSGEAPFTFTYDGEKFTCSEPGVTSLIDKTVTIEPVANLDSKAGNKGWSFTSVEVADFGADVTVPLTADTSFFRYTYNGGKDITFTVTAADKEVFVVDGYPTNTVTFAAGEVTTPENFVAFWTDNSGNPLEATLSYSIDGVKCKEKVFDLSDGKVYNLGTLTEAPTIYLVPNADWRQADAWYSAHLYNNNGGFADVRMTDEDADGIYECKVPANMTHVIFCRMNPAYPEFGWNSETETDRVWNETLGSSIGVAPNNYYYITEWTAGEWHEANYEFPVVTESYKVYVYQYENSWNPLNLYCWNSSTNAKYAGNWPGSANTTTETINGYTYKVWELPTEATGKSVMVILNNGSSQTGDSGPYTINDNLYLLLRSSAISVIEDPNNPEPIVEQQPRSIYATTTLSWANMNIYAWGAGLDIAWPGVSMTTETISGTKYYVYTFDKTLDGSVLTGVIFNNGSAQTVDITNVTLDKDRFYRVLTTQTGGKYKYQEIADPR